MSAAADALDPAEVVAGAVASCPGVARLAGGSPVEFATYLPGRRVPGVRMADGVIQVHLVAAPGTVLPDLAASVRQAVARVAPVQAVDVFVDDIDLDPDVDAGAAPAGPGVTT